MMDYTNRFLRYMLRRLSTRTTLYTEMVTSNTLVHCSESELDRFLGHDGDREQPLVLQLGGSDPKQLGAAAAIAEPWSFTAINLNCGCPSDRVAGSGCFGAALMRNPSLVADCCAAMHEGAKGQLPITVKCRIGVTDDKHRAAETDDEADYEALARFVEEVSGRGGVTMFAVHARRAVLGGLSPAQNRQVPPLRYELVHRLAADFPSLRFSLNGGVGSLDEASALLDSRSGSRLSGVMSGRAVIARPWDWATTDTLLYGSERDPAHSRRHVLEDYCAYTERMEAAIPQKVRRMLIAPAVNLFSDEPNGKRFRREVERLSNDKSLSAAAVIRQSSESALRPETLDAPPGFRWDYRERAYRLPSEGAETLVADEARAAAA
jgi:tRNA-dihydrouridine synthase A